MGFKRPRVRISTLGPKIAETVSTVSAYFLFPMKDSNIDCNSPVECSDCSAHTVYVEYANETEKNAAEKQVVTLWNMGKVIKQDSGG